MKVYEVCIKPTSDFATPLQGDSLFGHICWQIAHDSELVGEIDSVLSNYGSNPFCVVSDPVVCVNKSGMTEYIMPKPFCPQTSRKIDVNASFEERKAEYANKKIVKKAKWVSVSKANKLSVSKNLKLIDNKEISEIYEIEAQCLQIRQTHNSIDRMTGTTGTGTSFAPFASSLVSYNQKLKMAIFIGLREDINKSGILKALERIGSFGYGADATTGKGRFQVLSMEEINLKELGSDNPNALYALSAVVPEKDVFENIYFEPFIRFGRHGDVRANGDFPFKSPVLKAAAGAVFVSDRPDVLMKNYIGKAVSGLSMYKDTVEQGYSLVIPMKVEND